MSKSLCFLSLAGALLAGCSHKAAASDNELGATLAPGIRLGLTPKPAPPLLTRVAPDEAGAQHSEAACPEGMLLVSGSYCPSVQHKCLRYLTPYGRYAKFRCAEYGEPRCASPKRSTLRYCIDRDEYTRPGENLPLNQQTFLGGQATCESLGKRLCTESEWTFACEGERMQPYPYGFTRRQKACNADRSNILTPGLALKDLRAASDAFPDCVSPFGVRNLSGNLEEFVVRDGSSPARAVMKGAYWQPGRNGCRDRQTVHGERYAGMETGFRCCSEAR